MYVYVYMVKVVLVICLFVNIISFLFFRNNSWKDRSKNCVYVRFTCTDNEGISTEQTPNQVLIDFTPTLFFDVYLISPKSNRMVHPVSSMLGGIYTVMCVFTLTDKLIHIVSGCHKHAVE